MKEIFQNLLWPAAAGNVAWSFFTLAIDKDWSSGDVAARLFALFLLAIYLGVSWTIFDDKKNHDPFYWIMDGAHLITVVTFSIATQLGKDWLSISLLVLFSVTAFGHLCGAWHNKHNLKLSLTSFLGIVVVCGSTYIGIEEPYNLSLSIFLVLIAWGTVRFILLPRIDADYA